jgi:hypothetical protein
MKKVLSWVPTSACGKANRDRRHAQRWSIRRRDHSGRFGEAGSEVTLAWSLARDALVNLADEF